jgi:hypothetical protein
MMQKAEWALERTVQITKTLRVHMTAGPGGFTSEWEPAMPRTLTQAQLNRYRRARDELLSEVGAKMGGGVLVVEL